MTDTIAPLEGTMGAVLMVIIIVSEAVDFNSLVSKEVRRLGLVRGKVFL